jgi:hypothetical protein
LRTDPAFRKLCEEKAAVNVRSLSPS